MTISPLREEEDGDRWPARPKPSDAGLPWFVAACLGSTVLIAGVVLVGGGWLGAVRPPTSQRLFVASGRGSQTCPQAFDAPDSWELRWEHNGMLEEICWQNALGVTECFQAMPHKPIRSHGSVNVSHGGTFTIRVVGDGPWTVEAYLVDVPKATP